MRSKRRCTVERSFEMENFYVIKMGPSSNIKCVLYDNSRCVLRVKFANTTEYDYYGVPLGLILDWQGAESVGKYFNDKVKGRENVFPCRKVVI